MPLNERAPITFINTNREFLCDGTETELSECARGRAIVGCFPERDAYITCRPNNGVSLSGTFFVLVLAMCIYIS